jgi:4-amino-4-deoxy-L-arabinose transferase-like glycosyltransferase
MLNNRQIKIIFVCIFAFIFLRIISFNFYPLFDKTEARYAEVAREMIVNHSWITPILEGKPFWAKPPLSSWAICVSYKIFGINDFSSRFPSMIFSILSLFFIFIFGLKMKNKEFGILAVLVTLTSSVFYVLSDGVMTDPSLLFSITLAMTSFFVFIKTYKKIWAYMFFLGLGLSALAKGPIGIIFIICPIFIWLILFKELKNILKNIPIISGSILFLLIAVPWYVLAEIKTPGFLSYFFIGEHFYRYIYKSWKGDLYGHPASCPLGTIWFYALIGFLPWIFIFIKKMLPIFKIIISDKKLYLYKLLQDKDKMFLFLWAIIPMLLFTFSKNILITYVLPVTVQFAVLATSLLLEQDINFKQIIGISFIIPVFALISIFAFQFFPSVVINKSQKTLVEKYITKQSDYKLYYWKQIPYSAMFYSNGEAKSIENIKELNKIISTVHNCYFIIKKNDFKDIDAIAKSKIKKIDNIGDYNVFVES